jgi:hypothetical protein
MPRGFIYKLRIRYWALIIFIAGIIVYSFSVPVSFNNDEIAFIQRTEIKSFSSFISLCGKQGFDGVYYRPLGDIVSGAITIAANYSAPIYRIINAIINALNGVMMFLTGLYLFRRYENAKAISVIAAILFLLHPINNYAVIWHTALFERVFVFFYLFALLLYLRKGKWGVLSLIFMAAALLSKEMAFSFPVIIFILSFYINSGNRIKKAVMDAAPYGILAGLFILLRIIVFGNNIITSRDAHTFIPLMAFVKNYVFFAGTLLFPFFLKDLEYIIRTYGFILFLIIPLAFAAGYYIYKKYDKKTFCLIILLVAVSILPASRLFMRWYLYLPSVFFCFGISFLIAGIAPYKRRIAIMLLIVSCYAAANFANQIKWVKISNSGEKIIEQFKKDYPGELTGAGQVVFVNLPAKIDDIPLFQLGFDYHLNYYLKSNKQCEFVSKTVMKSISDTVFISRSNNILRVEAQKGNTFLPGDTTSYAKISIENSYNNTIYLDLSKIMNRTVFIFNHGKFIKIKDY